MFPSRFRFSLPYLLPFCVVHRRRYDQHSSACEWPAGTRDEVPWDGEAISTSCWSEDSPDRFHRKKMGRSMEGKVRCRRIERLIFYSLSTATQRIPGSLVMQHRPGNLFVRSTIVILLRNYRLIRIQGSLHHRRATTSWLQQVRMDLMIWLCWWRVQMLGCVKILLVLYLNLL